MSCLAPVISCAIKKNFVTVNVHYNVNTNDVFVNARTSSIKRS